METAKVMNEPNSTTDMYPLTKPDKRLSMAYIYVAIIALFVGGLMGLLQTLVRSGKFTLPWGIDYYQILTVHGVVLALVRSEEHTSELQSRFDLVCRLLLPPSPSSPLFPYTTLFRSCTH